MLGSTYPTIYAKSFHECVRLLHEIVLHFLTRYLLFISSNYSQFNCSLASHNMDSCVRVGQLRKQRFISRFKRKKSLVAEFRVGATRHSLGRYPFISGKQRVATVDRLLVDERTRRRKRCLLKLFGCYFYLTCLRYTSPYVS